MAPPRRKRLGRSAAAAAGEKWKAGDLVLAKLKGFPAWPAMISEPEKWGFSAVKNKSHVYFYGTKQIAFCNNADIEAFTEEKMTSLLIKCQRKGADFVKALNEIIDAYESLKKGNQDGINFINDAMGVDADRLGSPNERSGEECLKQDVNKDQVLSNLTEDHDKIQLTPDEGKNCVMNSVPEEPSKVGTKNTVPPLSYIVSGKRKRDAPEQISDMRGSHANNCEDMDMLTNDFSTASCTGALDDNQIKNIIKEEEGSESVNISVVTTTANLPIGTVTFKRKKKANRSHLSFPTEDAGKVGADQQVELSSSPMGFQNSNLRYEVGKSGTNCKSDDEHLPLVKRARIRMGSPNTGSEVNELKESKEDSGVIEVFVSEKNLLSDSEKAGIITPGSKTTAASADEHRHEKTAGLSPREESLVPSQIDVEASLPLSKRLHRALEAMSANAVEDKCHTEAHTLLEPSIPANINGEITPSTRRESWLCSMDSTSNVDAPKLALSKMRAYCDSSMLSGFNSEMSERFHAGETGDGLLKSNEDIAFDGKTQKSSPMEVSGQDMNCTPVACVAHQFSSTSERENIKEDKGPAEFMIHDISKVDGKSTVSVGKNRNSFVSSGDIESARHILDQSTTNIDEMESSLSSAIKSIRAHSNGVMQDNKIDTFSLPQKVSAGRVHQKDIISPDSKPMKDLIAAAQAKKLLSQSSCLSDSSICSNSFKESVNPLDARKEVKARQTSPSKWNRTSTHNNKVRPLQNTNCTEIGSGKLIVHEEATAAYKALEALLRTLTRTKESIARATRLAMDCAKWGKAGEVVDTIVENLERESNLHKKVDLFFLVDSITQCSRNQKGGAWEVYPSLVQAVLPRLLCAAAPPGGAASENRRQCLKVLRLWLERKTLPEYTVRHHIREISSINNSLHGSTSTSRRSLRTERPPNDPLLQNEEMLVDEYGSNTGFELPLLCTKVRMGEDDSSWESKSFESVTPERSSPANDGKGDSAHSKKHQVMLAKVDGELEMEDVAPPTSEHQGDCMHQPFGNGSSVSIQNNVDPTPPFSDNRIPQQAVPPSVQPCTSMSQCIDNQQSQSTLNHPAYLNRCSTSSDVNHQHFASTSVSRSAYHRQAPPAVVAPNQFSHRQCVPPPPQLGPWGNFSPPHVGPWGNCSFPERYHCNVPDGENYFTERIPGAPFQHEIVDNSRFTSHLYPDNFEELPPSRMHGRPVPPPGYGSSASRRQVEHPFPRMTGHRYWRRR